MPVIKHKRVAAAQAESAWLDLKAGIIKTKKLIKEAKEQGADLLVLPELWLPGYPWYLWTLPYGATIPYTLQYQQNSMSTDSNEMKEIQKAAAEHSISVSFGFAEKRQGSIYMSNALILSDGSIACLRRKWKPTGMERVIFGEASGDVFNNVAFDDSLGFNVGNLQCWEHILPLLKFQTFTKHEQIHAGSWPPIFPHGGMEHFGMSFEGIESISSVYAMEGQCYNAMSTGLVSAEGAKKIGLDYALTGGVPPPGAFAIPPGGG